MNMTQATVKDTLPKWLELTEAGFRITLKTPVELCHVLTEKIDMRSPSVRDIKAANAAGNGDQELRELHLFASLTQIPAKDLDELKYLDYRRLQAGYFRLVEED
jgi:uncharacterized protein YecE (DUF72 family)